MRQRDQHSPNRVQLANHDIDLSELRHGIVLEYHHNYLHHSLPHTDSLEYHTVRSIRESTLLRGHEFHLR